MMINPVLPNRVDDSIIRGYLFKRGTEAFRHLAGYQPHKITHPEKVSFFQPIPEKMIHFGSEIMGHFRPDTQKDETNFAPKIYFLIILWVWLGDTNPYRFTKYRPLRISIARFLMKAFIILSGNVVEPEYIGLINYVYIDFHAFIEVRDKFFPDKYPKNDYAEAWLDAERIIKESVWETAIAWSRLSDEELYSKLRPFMFALLDKISSQQVD